MSEGRAKYATRLHGAIQSRSDDLENDEHEGAHDRGSSAHERDGLVDTGGVCGAHGFGYIEVTSDSLLTVSVGDNPT